MSSAGSARMFGTDGIRGVAGTFPLDDVTVSLIGRSLVRNLEEQLGRSPRIVIGRDTRESGPAIERALASGCLRAGATVELAGVITTPGVAFITRAANFDAGAVISASHNPYADNGIKVFSPTGRKLADEMERAIESDLSSEEFLRATEVIAARDDVLLNADRHQMFRQRYLDYLRTNIAGGLSLEGWKLGVDCANGAASEFAPPLFQSLGAEVEVIGAEPNGRNINEECGSLHLDRLQELSKAKGLDVAIAFDGDADRALFVDSEGDIVDGDATLLILGDFLRSVGLLAGNLIVATVMSNIGLELALKKRGIELARTQVGDRFVLEELLARGAKLGGEQSGHIILPDISLAGDGLITAIELMRAICASGRTLHELSSQMIRYPQTLVNVRVRSKPPIETVPGVSHEIDSIERELAGRGRILVRYSGTERLARVMIEGESAEMIERQAKRLAKAIQREIGE
jgi:phosphoglucosamine mutase